MCILPSSVGNKEPLEISERDITPLLGSGFKEVLGSGRISVYSHVRALACGPDSCEGLNRSPPASPKAHPQSPQRNISFASTCSCAPLCNQNFPISH